MASAAYQQSYPQQQQYQQPMNQYQQPVQQYQQPTQQQQEPIAQEQPQQPSNDQPVYIDTQHDDMIHDAQLDYYGCKLATCSSDRTIRIFNVSNNGASYTQTATIQNTDCGPIWSVAWSHPKFGSVLASCSFDGSIFIHREQQQQQRSSSSSDWIAVATHKNLHESSVNSVSFCPHQYGLILAGGSSDGTVSVLTHSDTDDSWDVSKIRDNALGVNAVSWGPYNNTYMRLVTAGCDNQVRFWRKKVMTQDNNTITTDWEIDLESVCGGELNHTDWVRDVAWSPVRVGGEETVASCSEDGTVLIWTKKAEDTIWIPVLLNQFDNPVWRVSWSLTGNVLAVSAGDGDVTLWKKEMDTGLWSRVSTVEETKQEGAAAE